jgi:hypothetical protein
MRPLLALNKVMALTGHNKQILLFIDSIDKAVRLIYMTATGFHVFERLRLANTFQ